MHTGSGTRLRQLREDALAQKFHLNVCMTAPKSPQQMLLVFNEKKVNGPRGSYIQLLDLLLVEPFGEEVLKVANQAKGKATGNKTGHLYFFQGTSEFHVAIIRFLPNHPTRTQASMCFWCCQGRAGAVLGRVLP